MKTITIIGCGWLGKQVAEEFVSKAHIVFGNYRSEDKIDSLLKIGVKPFQYNTSAINDKIPSEVINSTEVLILAIPPFDKSTPKTYGMELQKIAVQFGANTQVIFTSSTGIYPQKNGNYDENYDFDDSEKLSSLFFAESILKSKLSNRLSILRLGGLIGPERHPIKFLSGKSIEVNGKCPVSLVHSLDIIRIIESLIEEKISGEIFNVVYPSSLDKKTYYTVIANKLGITPPYYGSSGDVIRKVDSTKSVSNLNFNYEFDITDWF